MPGAKPGVTSSRPISLNLTQPGELEKLTAIADLDGDGSVEVAIAVTTEGVQSVFVLKADGTEMMRWRPFRAVRYGQGAPLGPGLVFTQVWPASPPDGTFYVAGHVPIEFASVLVHLEMSGRVLHEYLEQRLRHVVCAAGVGRADRAGSSAPPTTRRAAAASRCSTARRRARRPRAPRTTVAATARRERRCSSTSFPGRDCSAASASTLPSSASRTTCRAARWCA